MNLSLCLQARMKQDRGVSRLACAEMLALCLLTVARNDGMVALQSDLGMECFWH